MLTEEYKPGKAECNNNEVTQVCVANQIVDLLISLKIVNLLRRTAKLTSFSILDTGISVRSPSVRPSRSGYQPLILKWAGLENSGPIAYS